MARTPRSDESGAWHHVMNRGLAKRTVFENREAIRYFKSRIAHATRRRELEVHVFAILTTHFHLLIRSPEGRMAEGMRRIQNEYVRWFNRRNRRDGPLFRGRFLSRRVRSIEYRRILVSYIDRNPVSAGVAPAPESYEYGSARYFAEQDGPPWLNRSWVENDCAARFGRGAFTWDAYRRAYSARSAEGLSLVEQRLRHAPHGVDPLDDLVQGTPRSVLQWMRRKAALADGYKTGLSCVAAASVSLACKRGGELSDWRTRVGKRNEIDLWRVLEVGLLRDLSGLPWAEIARRIDASTTAAKRRYEIHRREIAEGEDYPSRAQTTAVELLACLG